MNCDTAKSWVFPYIDGELAAESCKELEGHLAACGPCRRLVELEREFQVRYVTPLRPDAAPAHVRERVESLLSGMPGGRHRRAGRKIALGAAAMVLLVVGMLLGIGVQSLVDRRHMLTELTEASVDQHLKLVRGLLPPDIVTGSPRTAEAWFRNRLNFNASLPELKSDNLVLLGARISHLADVEVAAVAYRLDDKNVSLFVIPEEAYLRLGLSERSKFKMLNHRGYDVIIWRHHGTGYTLVSEIGGRACLVCHSPDEKVDAALEPAARL